MNIYQFPARIILICALLSAVLAVTLASMKQHTGTTVLLIGSTVILLLCGFLLFAAVLLQIWSLPYYKIKKLAFNFVGLFIILSMISFLMNSFKKEHGLSLFDLGTPFGLAIGLIFMPLLFTSAKNESKD